jgi:hypothetical protein
MSLAPERARQLGAAAGVLFVVVALVALFLPGAPPKANEVAQITTWFTEKRGAIMAGNALAGLAFALFLLFASALRAHFAAEDRTGTRPGAAILPGAVTFVAMVLAGNAVMNGAVFDPGVVRDPTLSHALYYTGSDLYAMSGFGLAVFFAGAATAIAISQALPSALAPAAVLLAVLNLLSGIGLFARSGFFAIGGALGWIVPLASLIWVLAVSILLLRPGRARAPQTA